MEQQFCYNCFSELSDASGQCPYCGFDLAENAQKYPLALPAGTVLNNRYITGRVLGQGGFGITYLAFDTQLGARVAIKEFMPSEISTRIDQTHISVVSYDKHDEFQYGAERFLEEARTLAKFIGNPHIAGVSSYFDENDTSYFVMDYIEGVSFKSYIANNGGQVSIEDTLNIMIPVLRALSAVHSEGFIHRDVTPDNIYISKDGNVKLLDFGSARYSIGDKSKSLDVILKVGYAPKEQYIRRGKQGPFTDVYSCAACFYAAITGYLPPESLERLDNDTLVPISQTGIEIPEWLDNAILKGLAVQPEDRFQSADEFLNAIENQLVVDIPSGKEPEARPLTPAQKKKYTIGAAIAAVLIIAMVILSPGGGSTNSGGQGGNGGGQQLLKAEVPSIIIAGQEYSTDLQHLDLSNMNLTDEDIEPLKYMINLKQLIMYGNNITDLSSIANLTGLEKLNFAQNNVSDLSPLSGLVNLQSLEFQNGNNEISDIAALSNMTNIKSLIFPAETNIQDWSPIGNMVQLESIQSSGDTTVGSGGLNDFSVFSNMSNLKSLYISAANITTLEGLEGATSLQQLSISFRNSKVNDLSPLSNLSNLISLSFYTDGNDTATILSSENLSFLSGCANLRDVEFRTKIQLDSFEGIQYVTNLKNLKLSLYDSDIDDFNAFSSLTNLVTLEISNGTTAGSSKTLKSKDLSFVSACTKLDTLNIYVSLQESLKGIEKLTNLREFYMYIAPGKNFDGDFSYMNELNNLAKCELGSGVPIKNLNFLGNKYKLRKLSFYAYPYGSSMNLSPLKDLTELDEIYIYGLSDSCDLSPIEHVKVKNIY